MIRNLKKELHVIVDKFIGKQMSMVTKQKMQIELNELFEHFDLPIEFVLVENLADNSIKLIPSSQISVWAIKGILSSKDEIK